MMLILIKSLTPRLTTVAGHTRAGVMVAPYEAVRHVTAVDPPEDESPAETPAGSFEALLAEIEGPPPPARDPEIVAIEDRLDLADAMAADPHSERTKRLLEAWVVKELDRLAEVVPELQAALASGRPLLAPSLDPDPPLVDAGPLDIPSEAGVA